jgi:hypothetical protein
MIKHSFRVSILFTGIVLSGVVTAPAFAQNFGLMPRGSCPKISPSASYTPAPRVQQQQPAYDVAYATPTPAPAPQRPKRRGFASPF